MIIITEITFNDKPLRVEKLTDGTYQIRHGDKVTHPNLKAEDVIRALAFYMNNASTKK